ncbi:hypothetical protein KZZ52_27905 [Dactylosporangium sp. AC04546]|uniref:hypothetical protein n=1 Tax=Dactylosporangium sp. AC04546 TaxID=2862460 RepID=UPI001EE0DB54|nr:hypothetical protein [Dactylosporangium sp. AC04546]WVK89092.1 hypothetical protein KZZ52_27905 [Dactylosporangium sp. AC04546]
MAGSVEVDPEGVASFGQEMVGISTDVVEGSSDKTAHIPLTVGRMNSSEDVDIPGLGRLSTLMEAEYGKLSGTADGATGIGVDLALSVRSSAMAATVFAEVLGKLDLHNAALVEQVFQRGLPDPPADAGEQGAADGGGAGTVIYEWEVAGYVPYFSAPEKVRVLGWDMNGDGVLTAPKDPEHPQVGEDILVAPPGTEQDTDQDDDDSAVPPPRLLTAEERGKLDDPRVVEPDQFVNPELLGR